MSWLRFFQNTALKSELMNTVERIPKDLRFWRKEIRKLDKVRHKTPKQKLQLIEYRHSYSFYLGKLLAYLFVLAHLGCTGFVKKYETEHKFTHNRKKNSTNIGKL